MKRMFAVLLMVCALCVLMTSPIWAAWKAPAGSFLNNRVATVADLTKQISTDATVRMRYANHFKVAPDEVASRISELKLVPLTSQLKTTTWYIAKDGKSYKKSRVLPKGTMVFATKDNKPVLLWSCGNPLTTKLDAPKPVVKTASKTDVITKPEFEDPIAALPADPVEAVETKVLANPAETIAAAAITAMPAAITEAVVAEPVAAIPVITTPAMAALPPVVSAGRSLGWLGALGGVLGGVALAGGGGGGTNVVVPEPSSLIAIMTGLSALGILKRRTGSQPRK